MKVEELYSQDKDSQVGVTFQRQPYETCVDIFPELSPLGDQTERPSGEPVGTTLTTKTMEEAVCRAVKHCDVDEFQPIPLKRLDSGPTSHRLQGSEAVCEGGVCEIRRGAQTERSRHEELLDEIDNAEADLPKEGSKAKKEKKEGTLKRMKEKLKSMRGEKGEKGEKDEDGKSASKSLSKIFYRVNPVGKASRESFSKVFHRIGDALQKRDEDKEDKEKDKTLSQEKKDLEKKLKYQDKEP